MRKHSLKLFIVLFLSFVVKLSANVVGATKGEFNVAQGNAGYNLEILTPKGTAGLKPSLSISYSSANNMNGLLGVGFSLNGLSQISKCNQTLFSEKKDTTRNYNYCIDGQKLVTKNSNDSYGTNTEYRTEIDSYSKVIKDSSGWTVYTKDGLIYEYGKTSDSKDLEVFYRVNKIKDRYNNEINFIYDTVLKAISKITYSNNVIDFIYEEREDKKSLYTRGIKVDVNKRLSTISLKTANQEVSSYILDYKSVDNRSLVNSIKECVLGRCLEPVFFKWNDFRINNYIKKQPFGDIVTELSKIYPADYNGDGLVDLVSINYSSQNHTWIAISNGDGTFKIEKNLSEYPTGEKSKIYPADYNGDGLTDIVSLDNTNLNYSWIAISNGDGTFNKKQPFGDIVTELSKIYPADYNGDGLVDLVSINYSSQNHTWIAISNGDGTFKIEKNLSEYPTGEKSKIYPADYNGDGLTDIVSLDNTNLNYSWIAISNGDGTFNKKQPFGDIVTELSKIYPADYNGDGLVDLVSINYSSQNHTWIAISNGDGTFKIEKNLSEYPTGEKSKIYPADYNGDGLTDIVSLDNTNLNYSWIAISNGDGTFNKKQPFGDIVTELSKIYPADYNGDGLVDLVSINYSSQNHTWIAISNGDGTFKIEKNLSEYPTGEKSKIHPADYNGDGLTDIVSLDNTNLNYSWIAVSNSNKLQLSRITNHKDQKIEIEYSNLYDKDIYSSTEDLIYPNREVKNSGMKVVKSYSIDDGIGGKNKTSYKYENLAFNLERGSLGFKKVETLSETTNSKTIAIFNQTFPFIGTVKQTESFINDKRVSFQKSEYTSELNTENIYRPQVKSKTNITYDYNSGNELVKKETINSNFDQYGNIGRITTTTTGNGQVFTKIVNSSYDNYESNWILARLKESSVTHQKTGQSDVIRKSSFEYDVNTGTLNKETIEPGNSKSLIKTYGYDAYGNKTSETITGSGINSRTTTYEYDSLGKNQTKVINSLNQSETRVYNNRNQLKTLTGPNGLTTTWDYDEMGRKIREDRADGTYTTWTHLWDNSLPNSLYTVREKTNYLPEVVVYYDQYARKIRTVTTGFDGKKIYKDTVYNKIGKVYKEYIPYFEDESASEFVETQYDDLGRIVKIIKPDAKGRLVEFTTSYNDFEITKTNPKGNSKTTTYDALEKKIKVEDSITYRNYEYDAIGNLVLTTDKDDNKIIMEYDVFGHKTSMNDPDMGNWSYKYDALGQLKEQTDAKGQITTFEYDELGRKTKKIQGSKVSEWKYDLGNKAVGKLQLEKSTNGAQKTYTYDNLGRVSTETTVLNSNTYVRSFAYDQYGRIDYVIEPNNFKLIHSYNEYGFHYGVKSEKTQITNFNEEELNTLISNAINEESTNYQNYLDLKIKIAELETKLHQYESIYSSQEYDALLQSIRDVIINYKVQLDNYNSLVQEERNKIDYYYSMVAQTYNSTATNEQQINMQASVVDISQNKIDEYSSIAKTLVRNVSSDSTTVEVLDIYFKQWPTIQNQIIEAKDTYTNSTKKVADLRNQKFALSDQNFNYYYKVLEKDAFGRDTKFISGNGAITVEDYDYSGILNTTKTGYEDNQTYFRELEYDYDKNNNVTTRTDVKLAVTQNYLYDSIDRLTDVYIDKNSTSEHISYEYDELGNITNKSDVGIYEYSSSRPHAVTKAGNKTFEYDANGNMVRNDSTFITYSHSNKPVRMEKNGSVVTFKYDMNDRRFEKYSNGKTTEYIGKSYERIKHKNGNIEEKYFIYANGRVAAIQSNVNDGYKVAKSISYLHYDNLGSVDTITNNQGVVEQRMAYKPFGDRMALDKYGNEIDKSALKTNRGFTGHEHIDEFNFIHMNGRVYDPVIARFMSADPHIQSPYDTQSFNRYTYVKNNPLKYTDPSGFFFKKIFKKIKKYIKPIIAIVVAAVVTYFTAGAMTAWVATWGASFGSTATLYGVGTVVSSMTALGSFAAGALTGALAGFASGAILTGSLSGALKGAAFGALTGGLAGAIGNTFGHNTSFFNGNTTAAIKKAIAHGLSRAAIAKVQGYKISASFWSGFVSSGFNVGNKGYGGFESRTVIMGVVGGTSSVISGGKFANGAVTSAFQHLFNDEHENLFYRNKVYGQKGEHPADVISRLAKKTAIGRIISSGIIGSVRGANVMKTRGPAGMFFGSVFGGASGLVVGVATEAGFDISRSNIPDVDNPKVEFFQRSTETNN